MGYSISWMALQGKNKDEVLALASLVDTGKPDEANEAPASVSSLPLGWTVLFFNDYDAITPALLAAWLDGCRVVACQVDEHVMASNVVLYEDGRHLWTVSHQSDQGLFDLTVQGSPSESFEDIKKRLFEQQDENEGGAADVDYVFDVPLELAASLCGYRHDESKYPWGRPAFTEVAKKRRSLWSKLGFG
jgi:hypothetical protein